MCFSYYTAEDKYIFYQNANYLESVLVFIEYDYINIQYNHNSLRQNE